MEGFLFQATIHLAAAVVAVPLATRVGLGLVCSNRWGLSDQEAAHAERTFVRRDRRAVRELAAVWKPGVPDSENEECITRARELNKKLETALVTQLDEHRDIDLPGDRQRSRAAGK